MIIAVEGIDGCGKTTVANELASRLAQSQKQYQVAQIAFPNRESPTGRAIDWYLRTPAKFEAFDAHVHQALQVVNRLELLPELVRQDRLNVLSRYTPSALVYGAIDGCGREWLERVTAALPLADLCVLLECSPEEAFTRMQARGVIADQYERRGVDWFRTVAARYDELWATQPKPGSVADTRGTVWLRLATGTATPGQLADRLERFFHGIFACRCGLLHNAARTPCHDEEVNDDDEE